MIYTISIDDKRELISFMDYLVYLGYPRIWNTVLKSIDDDDRYIVLYETIKDFDIFRKVPTGTENLSKIDNGTFKSINDFKKYMFRKRIRYENNK